MKKFGKSYKNIGTASDPVYQLSGDGTGSEALDSTLVEKMSEFTFGEGLTPHHTEGLILIDRTHQARGLGISRTEHSGPASIYGAFINYPLPDGELADKVFEGYYNRFIISKTGKCYATGYNHYRQLGYKDGTNNDENWIGQVDLPENLKCIHVSTGSLDNRTFYYLMENGDLYGAGHNPYGQLFGLGNDLTNYPGNNSLGSAPVLINTNVKQAYIGGSRWTTESIGHTHTHHGHCGFVLKHDGTVETTGRNSYGQRGDGTTGNGDASVYQIWQKVTQGGMIDQEIVDMKIATESSAATVYARTSNNRLYTWGYNGYGQLGVSNTTSSGTPQITITHNVLDFWVTGGHRTSAYVLKTDGNIYSCGYNGYGQLGHGDTVDKSTWQLVPSLTGKNITKMFLGGYNSASSVYALNDDMELYTAGYNVYGQLGDGSNNSTNTIFKRSFTPSNPVAFRCYSSAYGNGVGFAVYADESGQLFGTGRGTYRLFDTEGNHKYAWTKIAGRL